MKVHRNATREPPAPAAAPFRVADRARWSDVDAAGIVCYGAYLRFFELAETELFRSLGLPVATIPERHGLWLVRRRVECDFFRPVFLDEEIEVFAYVARIGRTSLELVFLSRRVGEGELAAESRYALVAVDRERLTPVALSAELRDALAPARLEKAEALTAIGLGPGDLSARRAPSA